MAKLNLKDATYDSFRRAVTIPYATGRQEVISITHEALEVFANRVLDKEEALFCALDDAAFLGTVANSVPADDGMITITAGLIREKMDGGVSHAD